MDQPIKKRESYKDVVLMDRTFRVKKFDAWTGSYIAYQLINLALPPMLQGLLSKIGMPLAAPELSKGRVMAKQEFIDLQKDCLAVCSEVVTVEGKSAPVINPVMNENGSFRSIGLEDNAGVVLALTAWVLMFNVESFFTDGPWAELVANFLDTSPPDAQT
jgi:hypothetical protein